MKLEVIDLLIRAKNDGLQLHGDGMVGYFFLGEKHDQYMDELQELVKKHDQHWQEMDLPFQECIEKSGIEVLPY